MPRRAPELDRTVAMWRWIEERTATRIEPWRFGTVLYNDDFPRRYDSNFLRVERPVGTATPRELAAEADRLLAGLAHREIVVPEAGEGARLSAGFHRMGYEVDRLVTMVLRQPPGTPPLAVREVRAADVREAIVTTNRELGVSSEDAEMLADFRSVAEEAAGTRFFAVELEGSIVAYCELYERDAAAQIEDVNTLTAYRGRGAGTSVVLAAAAAAVDRGANLIWLVADADDWPQHLYGRLGFTPIGHSWQFVRQPAKTD